MSITITAIPIAMLALPILPAIGFLGNVITGTIKEEQANIIRNKQGEYVLDKTMALTDMKGIVYPTDFKNIEEILNTMEKAGYKTSQTVGSRDFGYKTFLGYYNICVNWQEQNGRWCATFKSMDGNFNPMMSSAIETFFDKIKDVTQREVLNIKGTELNLPKYEYNTVYQDKDLLLKTLEEHDAVDITTEDDVINCKINNFLMSFTKQEDEAYKLTVQYDGSKEDLIKALGNLNDEYCQNVQESTYMKIKERLSEHSLQIDQEEVLEDNSILLTINL